MPRKWTPLKRYPGVYSYPTQKGKRYGTRRKYKSSTGKSDYWSKSGFLSAADADLLLKKFELELATGKVGQIERHKVTVDAYFWRIYDRKVKLNI
ncbi:integrase [Lactiplantibacillus plantarum]|nr:integrase [Lactiplantibacillus plantarum]